MVKPGDIVKVKVLDVDKPRKRISLTMRLDDRHQDKPAAGAPADKPRNRKGGQRPGGKQRGGQQQSQSQGALGAAFAKAFEQQKNAADPCLFARIAIPANRPYHTG